MSNSGIESNNGKYENQLSGIIQRELVDLHGPNGYRTIMQTMMKISGKTEKEIIANYELFAELTEGIFGRLGYSKILDPIKLEINKIGVENIYQDEKIITKKPMRILIADDNPEILSLYEKWLELKGRQVVTVKNGQKCLEVYKRECCIHQLENYFDVVILDQKMPKMTGLQATVEILKINPHQRIIVASAFLEKTLLDALTRLNKAIEIIEKPFSLDTLDYMINNTTILKKLEKINICQDEKDINEKIDEAMMVLKT